MGEDTMSGLMFADDFVGISETPEGLQKQIKEALECTRKFKMEVDGEREEVHNYCSWMERR